MIETATLITLCMLFLIFFRPGKTLPLAKSLVIERAGQYHLTLAPQLNLAQTLLEAIASHIEPSAEAGQSSATQFFEVRDQQVTAHGYDFYLLAITLRDGILYFQAASPLSRDETEQLPTIREFAHIVLTHLPDDGEQVSIWNEKILVAAQHVAKLHKIQIKALAS